MRLAPVLSLVLVASLALAPSCAGARVKPELIPQMTDGELMAEIARTVNLHFTAYVFSDGEASKGSYLSSVRRELFSRRDWDREVRFNIEWDRIAIGMTAEQVRASWGPPHDINRTVTANSVREQWVYGYGASTRKYVYFENGVVTSWQD